MHIAHNYWTRAVGVNTSEIYAAWAELSADLEMDIGL